jgi:hypothetical protein
MSAPTISNEFAMSTAPKMLLSLPDELLRTILSHLATSSPPTLAATQATCSRLRAIGADPLLWASACAHTFRWWPSPPPPPLPSSSSASSVESQVIRHLKALHRRLRGSLTLSSSPLLQGPPGRLPSMLATYDFKALFADRWSSSAKVQRAVWGMVERENGRLDQLAAVLDQGLKAKDVLLRGFYATKASSPDGGGKDLATGLAWDGGGMGDVVGDLALRCVFFFFFVLYFCVRFETLAICGRCREPRLTVDEFRPSDTGRIWL